MSISSYAHAFGPNDELTLIDDDDILDEEDDVPMSVFDPEKAHDDTC